MAKRGTSKLGGRAQPDPRKRRLFEAWLLEQPREWSVVIACRAALRLIPFLSAYRGDSGDIMLSTFRAVAIARFAVNHPNRPIEAAARTAADAAAAASDAARDFRAASDAAFAAADAADAAFAAANADNVDVAADVAALAAEDAATAAARSSSNVSAASLDDVRSDALQLHGRKVTSKQLMSTALWSKTPPSQISEVWPKMTQELLASGAHWSVWIDWYDDVFSGGVWRSERYDAAFTDIPGELPWGEGAVAVNSEIARRLAELGPDPVAIEGIPSPIAIIRLDDGRIGADAGSFASPTFAAPLTADDHRRALAACHSRARQLFKSASSPRFQGRSEYAEVVNAYLEWLPTEPDQGNILLADGEARLLNKLFVADESILPTVFAGQLSVLLEDHIALRSYYPEIERHYHAVRTGRLVVPLPRDAAKAIRGVIHASTPKVFHESVFPAIDEAAKPVPDVKPPPPEDMPPPDPGRPKPPKDPIAEGDPQRSRNFIVASAFNRIWGVLKKGKEVEGTIEGWQKVYDQFKPHIGTIIDWLSAFWPGGGPGTPPTPPTIGV